MFQPRASGDLSIRVRPLPLRHRITPYPVFLHPVFLHPVFLYPVFLYP